MPVLHEIIGDKFAELLRAHLPPEEFREMRERNATRAAGAPPVCHSHDFCDANAVMLDAYAALGLAEPDCRSRTQASLLNSAWSYARAKHLTAPQAPADSTAATLRTALQALLVETRDWADVLCGERPSLDAAISQAETALDSGAD